MQYYTDVVQHYVNVDHRLVFNIQNFRDHMRRHQSGSFLMMHLWANAVMITIHRPGLRLGQHGLLDTLFLCDSSRELSISSARTITSILELAEAVDPLAIISSPFVDQAIEIAGLVFGTESKLAREPVIPVSHNLGQAIYQLNYQACVKALQAIMVHWRGVGWTLTTMQQRYQGSRETDPAEGSVDPHSLIILSDTKMIQTLLKRIKPGEQETLGRTADMRCESCDTTLGLSVSGITDSRRGTITLLESSGGNARLNRHDTSTNLFNLQDPNAGLYSSKTVTSVATQDSMLRRDDDNGNTGWFDISVWDNVNLSEMGDLSLF